jgi:translation initiation factor 4A
MAEALDGQSDTTPDQADIESNWTETFESFDALELNEDLLRGIYDFGYEKPSALQQKCLLPLVRGHDTICQVYSGRGKTATIAIGVLQRIDVKNSSCQALFLAPTRESAQQIEKVVLQLGDFMQPQCLVCIGGTNQRDEILKLKEGVHIVVGTPTRVCSCIDRRVLRVTDIKMLVLDEADEMLLRGFNPSIDDVFKFMPQNVQVCLFSATMPGEVLGIAKRFMHEPVRIEGRYPLQSLAVRQSCCCDCIVALPRRHFLFFAECDAILSCCGERRGQV